MSKFQCESAEVGNGLNVRGSSEERLFLGSSILVCCNCNIQGLRLKSLKVFKFKG